MWNGAHGFLAKLTDFKPFVKLVPSIVVADIQNQFFQILILPQMLNRNLFEQLEHRVLGSTIPYQAQCQMNDMPCKCSLVSGGAHVLLAHWLVCVIFSATKLEHIWSFLRNPCIWKCSLNPNCYHFNWVLYNQTLLRLSRHEPYYAYCMTKITHHGWIYLLSRIKSLGALLGSLNILGHHHPPQYFQFPTLPEPRSPTKHRLPPKTELIHASVFYRILWCSKGGHHLKHKFGYILYMKLEK
jgi:hypothetical protein